MRTKPGGRMNPLTWLRTLRPKVLNLWHRGGRWMRPMVDRAKAKLWLFAGIVLIAAILWSIVHYREWLTNDLWIWLGATPDGRDESNSATLRNVGLVIAAVVALPLAIWRSRVAERQADTAQLGLQNERYQKGAEMLGNNVLSVRLGGVYALQRLAEEHPDQYHIQTMKLLCAFARHPTRVEDEERELLDNDTEGAADTKEDHGGVRRLRPDVEAVMEAIATRGEARIKLERTGNYVPKLSYADLRNLWLFEGGLSGVQLVRANLSGAFLHKIDFSGASLFEANLSGARINGANFSDASLLGACLSSVEAKFADFSNVYFLKVSLAQSDLSGADLTGAEFEIADLTGTIFYKDGVKAKGLTQRQFRIVHARPDDPPILDGLIDSETDHPIDWDEITKVADR